MSVAFPAGLGAKGNEGVAGPVASTPGTLGYVELVYAVQNKLAYAAVSNAAGAFVMPTPASITAAGEGAMATMPRRPARVLRARSGAAPAPGRVPHLRVHLRACSTARRPTRRKGKALVDFLAWAVHEGQTFAEPLSYAPLPAALVPRIEAKLAAVTGPDSTPPAAGPRTR